MAKVDLLSQGSGAVCISMPDKVTGISRFDLQAHTHVTLSFVRRGARVKVEPEATGESTGD